jgi:hypothetical protein
MSFASLEETKSDPAGVVMLEGDDGGNDSLRQGPV